MAFIAHFENPTYEIPILLESMAIQFSHQELSLMVFALQGPQEAARSQSEPACEEACPVASHFEELFGGGSIPREKRLASHLNNHLREALLECGMLELMGPVEQGTPHTLTPEDRANLRQMNERLRKWNCEVNIDSDEQLILHEAVSRLPRAAWLSMPRTMWRLRKKLKPRRVAAEPAVQ